MTVNVREEREGDNSAIFSLIVSTFADMQESDHREQFLVERLHRSGAFIPQLSLVAETGGRIVGYILLSEVAIESDNGIAAKSLGVAPLAVLPEYQRQGIGGLLLQSAHRRAAGLGYGSAVLLGHDGYYPRFGYRRAIDFGIEFPFDVPHELCMVIELVPGALNGVSGVVRYPDAFLD